MKRRANGEGSVRQRKDGRWEAIVTMRDGHRHSVYAKTQRAVLVARDEAIRTRESGLPQASARLTVEQFLTRWLASRASTVRASTARRYGQLVRVHIVPRIGRVPVTRLAPAHLEGLYASMLSSGSAPMTVRHVHALLHSALKQAVRTDSAVRNVATMVDPPRSSRREMKTLSESETRVLLQAAAGEPLEALYALAVTTGMRQGELLGLRWSDVDLEQGRIHVQRSLQRTPSGPVLAETKTAASRRNVSLTQAAGIALRKHRARQVEERLRAGPGWHDDDLVFANEVGRPLDASNVVQRSFRHILRRSGVPRIRFHDLRHTAATLLLGRNIHPKVVSEQLGHAQIAITLDLYSHVIPSMRSEAAAALDAVLAGT